MEKEQENLEENQIKWLMDTVDTYMKRKKE